MFKWRAALLLSSIAILSQIVLAHAGNSERLDSLEEQATTLQQMSVETQTKGSSTQDARRVLNEVVAHFSADELNQIQQQGDGVLPPEKQKLWAQLKSRYLEIENAQDHVIERYDNTASSEIDFLTDYGVSVASNSHQEIRSGLREKDAKRLDQRLDALKQRYDAYLSSKKLYGTPKDVVRKKSLNATALAFREYFQELERLAGPKQSLAQKVSDKIKNTLRVLKAIFEKIKVVASVFPEGSRLIKSVFLPSNKVEAGKFELTKNFYELARTYTKSQGFEVTIQGRENIPVGTPPGGKVLNVFTPSHRHALNDVVLMAHYSPDDTLIFAAIKSFLPKPLVAPVAKNPAVVAVGKGSDPINALIERLKQDRSRNVLIYPEGGIPAALEESTPIRSRFSSGLIEKLAREGYEIRFIPVTYVDSSRYLNQMELASRDVKLTARVSEPIEPQMHLAMRTIGKDDRSINRFIRSTWFENLPTDETHVMGLLRPKAAVAETESFVTKGKGEKSLCYPTLTKALQELK